MPKEKDRHTGRRETLWFPWTEYETMQEGMALINETNKSNFIRSAVRNFVTEIKRKKGIK